VCEDLPECGAVRGGQPHSPPGPTRGEVVVFSEQTLSKDDLGPLLAHEGGGEAVAGRGNRLVPQGGLVVLPEDREGPAEVVAHDLVGEPVGVEHLDPVVEVPPA